MNKYLRLISVLTVLSLFFCFFFSGCSSDDTLEDNDTEVVAESEVQNLSTRKAKVAIIQYMSYSSLDECCEGISKSLDEVGIEYDVMIGSDETPEEDCQSFAQDIAISGGYDLVVTIATPATVAVYSSISSSSRIPVIFCAVTDPIGAQIVVTNEKPTNNCTGVSSAFNITEQLNMINTFQPYITKLGVIYTKSEENTTAQLATLKEEAQKLGITIYEAAVEHPSEIETAAAKMVPEVEAITLLPDNMMAVNSWDVVNQAIIGNIPVYGVNLSQVSEGCLAGYCYDFKALGEKTGETAVSVLRGQSAAETPVTIVSDCTLYANSDMLEELEIEIPQEYKNAKTVKTSYEN